MEDFAIVTASSDIYFTLLRGLLDSMAPMLGQVPVHVLDLGLLPNQLEELHDRHIQTVQPDWDVTIKSRKITDRHGHRVHLKSTYRAFISQPFLPKYVRDAKVIFWIDADAWFQDISVVEQFVAEARRGNLAISIELDRSYSAPYWRLRHQPWELCRGFGLKTGFNLAKKKPVNVGVFALAADAPHWGLWQNAARSAYHRYPHERTQQMALQYAVNIAGAPIVYFPATCNWQTWEATPLFDNASGMLVEPQPPYRLIEIIHNAQENKNLLFDVKQTGASGIISGTMRYEEWAPRRQKMRVVA